MKKGLQSIGTMLTFKFFVAISMLALISLALALDPLRLQTSLVGKYGAGAMTNFNAWQSMMEAIKDKTSEDKIKRVNEFFNRRITWGDDQKVWGQLDFWATGFPPK